MTDKAQSALTGELDSIADLVNRLGIRHGDPERFHLDKDEAVRRLRKLASASRGPSRAPSTTWRPEAPKRPVADPGGVFQHLVKRERRG